jgi:hypothetical protein
VFGKWIWIISLKSNIIPLTRTNDIIEASAGELSTKDLTCPVTRPVRDTSFWAGPGEDGTILKAASAYEATTKHRRPPPAFGPLRGEP